MTDPREPGPHNFIARADLAADLRRLSLEPGDAVMIHAAMSRIGRLLGGPDTLINAALDAVGPDGTILAYTDWDAGYEALLDGQGRVPAPWRDHVPPFEADASRAARENGVFPEFLRTRPGARRSGNPGASVATLGARAEWFAADHPLDYGYGPGSPLEKLVAAQGKVLLAGAPLDTITLLHHAEHLARLPSKRVRRREVPFAEPTGTGWRMIEEFETAEQVVAGLAEDSFATIVADYLATGRGRRGPVGHADGVLVEAAPVTDFALAWLERACAG